MAVVTQSTTLEFGPECAWGQQRYDKTAASDATGAQQVGIFGPPRWTMTLTQPGLMTVRKAGLWMALVVALRGRVNVLAGWDPVCVLPQGTARGVQTLNAAAAAGATALSVGGMAAGATYLAGDRIQLGAGYGTSQVVMVLADAVANAGGVILLQTEPPLLMAFAAATAVSYTRPIAYFRQRASSTRWTYANRGMSVQGMSA
jgi:hypothetical protein